MIPGFVQFLQDSPGSIALRESLYLYSITETVHVLSIMLFVGTVLMFDLRLLGFSFREIDWNLMVKRVLPWSRIGFVLIVTSGIILFYANPERMFHSVWLRIKLMVLLLAGLNAFLFHLKAHRRIRVAGAVSLVAWIAVIVLGRMIAYSWFDCGRTDSLFVQNVAQCPVEEAAE